MLLVFIGTGAVVMGNADPLTIGLAFGLTVTMMAYAVGGISGGHFNPAVTLAMLINKRIDVKNAIQYMASQFIGAVVGSGLVFLFVNDLGLDTNSMGQNDLTIISPLMAILFEAILTFIFIFVILMVTSKKFNSGIIIPVVIGLTLAVLIVVALNVTGGSFNPARSFGPAIFAGGTALTNYWVFLVGPMIGGAAAAVFAKCLGSEDK